MKILMVSNYGWEFGGGETHISTLMNSLIDSGHKVILFSSNDSPKKKHFSNYEFKNFKKFPFRTFARLFNLRSLNELNRIIKKEKPDIIHIHSIDGQISPSIFLGLHKIPAIMTIHSNVLSSKDLDISSFSNIEYQLKNFLWRRLRCAKKYIFPSDFMKKYFKRDKLKNSITIYNGIKLFRYSKIKNFQSLLYIGRLSKEKGVSYLIKGMQKIVQRYPHCNLNIVGEGPEKEKLKILCKNLSLDLNINFLGQVSYKKIEKYYKQATIIIIPSICQESFCLVGPEAMSVGRPVIASNIGGIPEWLKDGETGYLVPPKSSRAIISKTTELLSNPKLAQKIGLAGRKRVEREFNIKLQIKQIEKIYQEEINKYSHEKV